jgi:hypothetical protein
VVTRRHCSSTPALPLGQSPTESSESGRIVTRLRTLSAYTCTCRLPRDAEGNATTGKLAALDLRVISMPGHRVAHQPGAEDAADAGADGVEEGNEGPHLKWEGPADGEV